MKPNELLQAMSEIRPEYIEAAAKFAVPSMQIRPKRTRTRPSPRTIIAASAGAAATVIAVGTGIRLIAGKKLPPADPVPESSIVTEITDPAGSMTDITGSVTESTGIDPETTDSGERATETVSSRTEKTTEKTVSRKTTEKTEETNHTEKTKTTKTQNPGTQRAEVTTASVRQTQRPTTQTTAAPVTLPPETNLTTVQITLRTESEVTPPATDAPVTPVTSATVFTQTTEYTRFSEAPLTVTEIQIPTETKPPVTKPPVTKPTETKPPVTKPTETKPPVTKPTETKPPVTKPTETKPPVTKPTETKPPVTKPTETTATTCTTVTTATVPAPHDPGTKPVPGTRPDPHTHTPATHTRPTETLGPQGPAGSVTTVWIPAHMAEKKELYNVTALVTLPPWHSGDTFTTALSDVPVLPYRKTVEGTLYPGALEDSVLCEVITDKTQIRAMLEDAEEMEPDVKAPETEKQILANPRMIRIRWQCNTLTERQYGVGTAVMDTAGMLNLLVPVYTPPDSKVTETPCICELYLLADDSALPVLRSLNLSMGFCRDAKSPLGFFASDALSAYNRHLSEDAAIRLKSTHY